MAFHSSEFPLVSFSRGGDPWKVRVAVDGEAKVEEEVVVIAPMALGDMAAEVVDMISVAKVARCDLFESNEEEALLPCESIWEV